MAVLPVKITEAGLIALVGDSGTQLGQSIIAQIGFTATPFTPSSILTALPGEFMRLTVAGEASASDVLHVVAVDESEAEYSYSGFGLYFDDGTLFAVYGQSTTIAEKTAATITHLAIDIQLEEGDTANIAFGNSTFLNPPATTTRQGVVALATAQEAAAGTNAQRALTPATMQAALLAMLLRVDGAGTGIDADLLDGQHGAWYADIAARLGYVPFDSAGFTSAAIRSVLGYTPQDAAAFSSGSNANGYWRKAPDGWLEQWGTGSAADPWSANLTFPLPFGDLPSINLQVTSSASNNGAFDGNKVNGRLIDTATYQLGSDDGATPVFWRAIGKQPAHG